MSRLAFAEPETFGFDAADTAHFWTYFRTGRANLIPVPDHPLAAASDVSPTMADEVAFITGLTADNMITDTSFWGLRGETAFKWGETIAGTGATISYGFAAKSGFTAREIATFEKALAVWAAFADLTFIRADTQESADVVLRRRSDGTYSEQDTTNGAGSTLGTIDGQATISFNTRGDSRLDLSGSLDTKGGFGFGAIVHEIGHMLGLGHGGAYNVNASPRYDQYSAFDHTMYTAMSYFNWDSDYLKYAAQNPQLWVNWGHTDDGVARTTSHTIMMLDIVAIQQLYGAQPDSVFTGGQVYGFRTNIEGPLRDFYNFNRNTAPIVTIYNEGTGNTLNASGYDLAQVIDLRPGRFSDIGGLVGNVGIALGTVVEKGIGGSGNDSLLASDVDSVLIGGAGDDVFAGGLGQDRLTGGAGADLFVFNDPAATYRSAARADIITDFSRADGDLIWLLGIDVEPLVFGDQGFTFIGTDAFSGDLGELRVTYRPAFALVQGDIDGDAKVDFAIRVNGVEDLQASDFML